MTNISDLIHYLCSVCVSMDDVSRARAIYRWITAHVTYDVDAYKRGYYTDAECTWLHTFKTRKATCVGYALLFQKLCR